MRVALFQCLLSRLETDERRDVTACLRVLFTVAVWCACIRAREAEFGIRENQTCGPSLQAKTAPWSLTRTRFPYIVISPGNHAGQRKEGNEDEILLHSSAPVDRIESVILNLVLTGGPGG